VNPGQPVRFKCGECGIVFDLGAGAGRGDRARSRRYRAGWRPGEGQPPG
jgi:hypothetical protein